MDAETLASHHPVNQSFTPDQWERIEARFADLAARVGSLEERLRKDEAALMTMSVIEPETAVRLQVVR